MNYTREPATRRLTDWTPRARGAVYCSPACGGGCTREQHDRAKRSAAFIARSLGAGWEPIVWENLGWHFKARHEEAKVEIYPAGVRRFWATTTNWQNDPSARQMQGHGRTPGAAVAALVAQAERTRDAINATVDALRATLDR